MSTGNPSGPWLMILRMCAFIVPKVVSHVGPECNHNRRAIMIKQARTGGSDKEKPRLLSGVGNRFWLCFCWTIFLMCTVGFVDCSPVIWWNSRLREAAVTKSFLFLSTFFIQVLS